MIGRLWDLAIAVALVALTIDAGWLGIPHDRLGGIGCLVLAGAIALWALRPLRRD